MNSRTAKILAMVAEKNEYTSTLHVTDENSYQIVENVIFEYIDNSTSVPSLHENLQSNVVTSCINKLMPVASSNGNTSQILSESTENPTTVSSNNESLDTDASDNTTIVSNSSDSEYFPSDQESEDEYETPGGHAESKRTLDSVGSTKRRENQIAATVCITSKTEQEISSKSLPSNGRNKKIPENSGEHLTNTENQIETMVEISDEVQNSNEIFIRSSSKNKTGSRKRDKVHNCLYCDRIYKDLQKHLSRKHADEAEVAKVLAYRKNSEERRNGFIHITRLGDYYHNCEVLQNKNGELILSRVPTPNELLKYKPQDYGPCPECLAFMLKQNLWHHVKYYCTENRKKSANSLRRQVMSESNALMTFTYSDLPFSSDFNQHIIASMKNDTISLICKGDDLIMKLGIMQFEKYHTSQNQLIRQSLRQLGRLLFELRKMDESRHRLSSWLKPSCFDNLIAAVKNISKIIYNAKSRPQFSVPSLALKLGHSIRKCVAIQKGVYLRKENSGGVEELNSFLTLMDLEWCTKISSSALATLTDRKLNSTELLPLTDDLIKLNEFLNKHLTTGKKLLSQSPTYRNWSNLASVVLCKLILFNKRRSGEASKMTLLQYSTRPVWSHDCAQEFRNTFTDLELQLASRLTIVQIKGKRGRTVNVLLTPEVKEVIDILLIQRDQFVSPENVYVFARSTPSTECLRGHDCLRNFAYEANLVQPELVTGTKLRKYIATVCQVFNLTENETDWLARHLGHDVRVHREFYRLHDSSVELTKVSRLLLAVEKGVANEFRGKKLDEINICDLPALDIDKEPGVEGGDEEESDLEESANLLDTEENSNKVNDKSKLPDDKLVKKRTKTQSSRMKTKSVKETTTGNSRTKGVVRRPWKPEEVKAVLDFFKKYVKKNRSAPGRDLCSECIDMHPALHSRTWKDVKYYVYNYMKKICK